MSEESVTTGPPEAKPASTVVLMRDSEDGDGPFEIFFVKRHQKSKFMANAFVYPGGSMETSDCEDRLALHCRGYLPQELADRLGLEEDDALGHHIAACREVFEESGALFATESDGEPIDFSKPAEVDRYQTYRVTMIENEVSFEQMVEWEDLNLRIDAFTYFAHWITPELEGKRFDARFFLARAPAGQALVHDQLETTDSLWISPEEALKRHARGDFHLAPPTLCTLQQLAKFGTVDEAIDHYASRPVTTIQPHPVFEEGSIVLLLPGDPDFPEPDDGAGQSVEGATRVALVDGRWVTPDRGADG